MQVVHRVRQEVTRLQRTASVHLSLPPARAACDGPRLFGLKSDAAGTAFEALDPERRAAAYWSQMAVRIDK